MNNIKQYKKLKFTLNNFYPLNPEGGDLISFIYLYFHEAYRDIHKQGIANYVALLDSLGNDAFRYNEINLCFDQEENLIYIFESLYYYRNKPTTQAIEKLLDTENFLELCRVHFVEYASMTKENFVHILHAWEKFWNQKSIMFMLLYLDDKDWYDILPFDSQEAMEKFVDEHTK